jgi:hypothetical protein
MSLSRPAYRWVAVGGKYPAAVGSRSQPAAGPGRIMIMKTFFNT